MGNDNIIRTRLESFRDFCARTQALEQETVHIPLQKIKFKITDRCNLRCRKCSYWQIVPKQEIPINSAKHIVDRAYSLGARTVKITGGEPLLYRDLPALCDHCHERGILVGITTNGLLLSEETWAVKHPAIAQIAVSIDAFNEMAHDANTGVAGSWGSLQKSLDALFSSTDNTFTVLQMVVDDRFEEKISDLISYVEKYPFTAISLIPLRTIAISDRSQDCYEALLPVLNKLGEYCRHSGRELWRSSVDAMSSDARSSLHHVPCYAALTGVVATPRGIQYCCSRLGHFSPIMSLETFVGESDCQDEFTWSSARSMAASGTLTCVDLCTGGDAANTLKFRKRKGMNSC